MRGNVDLGDMRAFYKAGHKKAHKGTKESLVIRRFFVCVPFVALFSDCYRFAGGATLEVGGEALTILVRDLVELRAQLPFVPRPNARAAGVGDGDHGFDRSVGQVDSDKQHASDL